MTTLWSSRVEQLDNLWSKPGCRFYRKVIRDKIVELAGETNTVLDVGCGSGLLYKHLPPATRQNFVGVDFTPEFIKHCRRKFPNVRWKVEDATKLSFPDSSFYLVNSMTVLQHIVEWQKAASELIRVAQKYVISTCRTHWAPTRIVAKKPVLRRRFNPKDIVEFYQQYGDVDWQWVLNVNGQKALAMYIVKL